MEFLLKSGFFTLVITSHLSWECWYATSPGVILFNHAGHNSNSSLSLEDLPKSSKSVLEMNQVAWEVLILHYTKLLKKHLEHEQKLTNFRLIIFIDKPSWNKPTNKPTNQPTKQTNKQANQQTNQPTNKRFEEMLPTSKPQSAPSKIHPNHFALNLSVPRTPQCHVSPQEIAGLIRDSSWWLNQPIRKIWSSNWIISLGIKNKKNETTTQDYAGIQNPLIRPYTSIYIYMYILGNVAARHSGGNGMLRFPPMFGPLDVN